MESPRMPEAVQSFVSAAVPAVALWVPFNITVREKMPQAKKLIDASTYYPQAANVGGWAASNAFFCQEPPVVDARHQGLG
jgi:NitT/TauT family transport system substrate-binding protein